MESGVQLLLGLPLGVLTNWSYDKIKRASAKVELKPLRPLLFKAFYRSVREHSKRYDDTARTLMKSLRKAVKSDEERFLAILHSVVSDLPTLLKIAQKGDAESVLARAIAGSYTTATTAADEELFRALVADWLHFYFLSFLALMNEQQALQAVVLQCLKIQDALDILKGFNADLVRKQDFDELRALLLRQYYDSHPDAKDLQRCHDEYVRNKYKYLTLRGISPRISGKEIRTKLNDVFVPVEIAKEANFIAQLQPHSAPPQSRSRLAASQGSEERLGPEDILSCRRAVILGDPGSGKSTILRYLAVHLTRKRRSNYPLANLTPLVLRASAYADYWKHSRGSLYGYITEVHDVQFGSLYRHALEHSTLVLFVDGLDEVTDTARRLRVVEQVHDLVSRYPGGVFIISSRVVGYSETRLPSDFTHFKLQSLRSEQIEQFSHNWYNAIAASSDKDYTAAKQQAKDLCGAVHKNQSVQRLASNPLLMTIIAMIHFKGRTLPNRRVELYDISTETFLEHWVRLRVDDDTRLKDKSKVVEILAPIAFHIHSDSSRGLIEEKSFNDRFYSIFRSIHPKVEDGEVARECKELLKFVRSEAGFFYEQGVDDDGRRYLGFAHQTFQEYLAAIEVSDLWAEEELRLREYVFNPRWTEILRLTAAQLRLAHLGRAGRRKATDFVNHILTVEDPFPEAERPLQLAALILADDVGVSDELVDKIFLLIKRATVESSFPRVRRAMGVVISELLNSEYRQRALSLFQGLLEANGSGAGELLGALLGDPIDTAVEDVVTSWLAKVEPTRDIVDIVLQTKIVSRSVWRSLSISLVARYLADKPVVEIERVAGMFQIACGENWLMAEMDESTQELVDVCEPSVGRSVMLATLWVPALRCLVGPMLLNSQVLDATMGLVGGDKVDLLEQRDVLIQELDLGNKGRSYHYRTFEQYYSVLIRRSELIYLVVVDRQFSDLRGCRIKWNSPRAALEQLGVVLNEHDSHRLLSKLQRIRGTVGRSALQCARELVKANDWGIFLDWGILPFDQLDKLPSELSRVIMEHSEYYQSELDRAYTRADNAKLLLRLDQIRNVPAPVKVMVARSAGIPASDEIVEASLQYMRRCRGRQRDGVFSILYESLNPFAQQSNAYTQQANMSMIA